MKLYEFFDSPEKWSKGTYCRDAAGNPLNYSDIFTDKAVCFCVSGAIAKIYDLKGSGWSEHPVYEELYKKLAERGSGNPVYFNDNPDTTFEEFVAVLKELDV